MISSISKNEFIFLLSGVDYYFIFETLKRPQIIDCSVIYSTNCCFSVRAANDFVQITDDSLPCPNRTSRNAAKSAVNNC